jgi:hypothetical protein
VPISLPEMPDRIKRLPRDHRGYPVPWFVSWVKDGKPVPAGIGEPDFRVIARGRLWTAVSAGRCWVCGVALGQHRVYVIGPMCVVNRVTSEPPNHRSCAEFAAQACPFLVNPRQKRSEKHLPEDRFVAGMMIPRNPGATCLYETNIVKPFRSGEGYLFKLGEPDRIDWWANGRQATREEVLISIETGYPLLYDAAKKEGMESIRALETMHKKAMELLPA